MNALLIVALGTLMVSCAVAQFNGGFFRGRGGFGRNGDDGFFGDDDGGRFFGDDDGGRFFGGGLGFGAGQGGLGLGGGLGFFGGNAQAVCNSCFSTGNQLACQQCFGGRRRGD